jgi:hypothetical protein
MENTLVLIKESLTAILKKLDPDVDVFFEEIKATDRSHGLDMPRTYYFVEIIPNTNNTVDRFFSDTGVLVDVAYHEENESNTAYLIKAAELDGAIRPVFSFGDRHITVPGAGSKVVDHVLHFSFSISFRQARDTKDTGFPVMKELELTIGKGE